jgi:hypothetical protein
MKEKGIRISKEKEKLNADYVTFLLLLLFP